jgi:hypothetical protein
LLPVTSPPDQTILQGRYFLPRDNEWFGRQLAVLGDELDAAAYRDRLSTIATITAARKNITFKSGRVVAACRSPIV